MRTLNHLTYRLAIRPFAGGIAVVAMLLTVGCGGHAEIAAVKGGVLKAIPTTTLEKYFDGVYKSSDWRYQESAIGEKIVVAKGYIRDSTYPFTTLEELRRAAATDPALQTKMKMYLEGQRSGISGNVRQACVDLTGLEYPTCLSELTRRYSTEALNQFLTDDLSTALVKFRATEPRAAGLSEDAFVDVVKPLLKRLPGIRDNLRATFTNLDYKELGLTSCKELSKASPEVPVSGKIAEAIRSGGEDLPLVPYECVPEVYRYEEWRFVIDPGKKDTFEFASFKPYRKSEAVKADELSGGTSELFWSFLRKEHEEMIAAASPVSKRRDVLNTLN